MTTLKESLDRIAEKAEKNKNHALKEAIKEKIAIIDKPVNK